MREKKMQYKILASDYDNTLVPFGEPCPRPAVVRAVKKMQAAGGKFVLSTGRAYPCINLKGQLGGIRFDYAITCNGACVTDRNGTIVAEHPLTNEEMYALVNFCEDYNYPLQFNFRDACYAYCEYEYLHAGFVQMNSRGLDCLDGEDQDRHLVDMPHAAFAAMPPEQVDAFQKKYGHLNLHWMMVGSKNADGYCYYDIVRGGIDKGVGLADLCEKMGLTLADAVAAGDSANDIGMLKAAGLGCCMANGTADAAAYAAMQDAAADVFWPQARTAAVRDAAIRKACLPYIEQLRPLYPHGTEVQTRKDWKLFQTMMKTIGPRLTLWMASRR